MPNGPNPAPSDANDVALMRARRMIKRLKHSPFIAIIVDQGRDKVVLYHTTGIDREKIAAVRAHLDEIEAQLPA